MSETSGNYVLMPITENGEVNAAPLMAYAEELKNPRRGEQVTAAFRRHDVDDDVMGLIEKAAELKKVSLYVNTDDNTAYYVLNDDVKGQIAL